MSKQYLALCMGMPEQQEFSVDVGIGQHASLKWVPCAVAVVGEQLIFGLAVASYVRVTFQTMHSQCHS